VLLPLHPSPVHGPDLALLLLLLLSLEVLLVPTLLQDLLLYMNKCIMEHPLNTAAPSPEL